MKAKKSMEIKRIKLGKSKEIIDYMKWWFDNPKERPQRVVFNDYKSITFDINDEDFSLECEIEILEKYDHLVVYEDVTNIVKFMDVMKDITDTINDISDEIAEEVELIASTFASLSK